MVVKPQQAGFTYRSGPVVWLCVIAGTCLALFLFQRVLWLVVPFLLALVMYYALLPIKLRLVMGGLSHDRAATLVSGVTLALVLGGVVVMVPWLTAEALNWQATAARYLDGGVKLLLVSLGQLESQFGILAQAHVSDEVSRQLTDFTEHFAQNHLPGLALGLAAWAPSLLLAPFLAFFMLSEGWRFKRFLSNAVPNAFFERTLCLLDAVDRTARLYFMGLIQLTLLDTLCLAIGLWFLGVSGPLALGFLTAVLAWVPYVGSVAGCLLVVLVAATDFPGNPGAAYGAIALFLAVRLLDDFLFMPLTIGKSLNMHPLLTVLMIFAGGAVAGIPGLMLVLPVLGIAMVVGEAVGMVLSDPRLQARHRYAKQLRLREVMIDLTN